MFCHDLGLRMFCHDLGLRMFCHDLGLRMFCHDLGLRMFRHDLGLRMFRHDLGLRVFRHCLGLRLPLGASDHFVRLAVVVLHHVQQMLRGLRHGVGLTFWGVSLVFLIAVHEALPILWIHLFELCHMLCNQRLRGHGSIDSFQLSVSL